ncbi:MAG: septum formation protein Maf [Desulfonatronovibrio sp. MSAO_Bac4]|nr:MAG: septum formation protein Maf [Desulfonatronovibrio sp. MSAO_Bac4]
MGTHIHYKDSSIFSFQGPFRSAADIILASASPRRQSLLTTLGISFQVIPAKLKEPDPEPKQKPEGYALHLADAKASEVADQKHSAVVIAADTIVVLDQTIMGKPRSRANALEMLKNLQDNTHRVITAVSILCRQKKVRESFFCETSVEMVSVEDHILRQYIDTGETDDKAGAYAIQGLGGFLIKSIQGSYTNVVGLPLAEVWTKLFQLHAITLPEKDAP